MLLQGDNINTLVKAANISVEPYWPALFAKLFERNSIETLLTSVGSGEFFKRPSVINVAEFSRYLCLSPSDCRLSLLSAAYAQVMQEQWAGWMLYISETLLSQVVAVVALLLHQLVVVVEPPLLARPRRKRRRRRRSLR